MHTHHIPCCFPKQQYSYNSLFARAFQFLCEYNIASSLFLCCLFIVANLINSRSQNASAGISETVKSSDKSSASIPKGKQGNMDDSNHLMNGAPQPSCKSSYSSSASISKGRPGVDEGNHNKNGVVDTQSSDEISDSTSSLMPKAKDKSVGYSSSSINGGKSLGLTSNLNDMSLFDKSGNSNKASAKRPKSSAQYQPDKWMLPDKSENALTQLNLAIVSRNFVANIFNKDMLPVALMINFIYKWL